MRNGIFPDNDSYMGCFIFAYDLKRIEAGMNRSTKRGRKQLETILKERKKTKWSTTSNSPFFSGLDTRRTSNSFWQLPASSSGSMEYTSTNFDTLVLGFRESEVQPVFNRWQSVVDYQIAIERVGSRSTNGGNNAFWSNAGKASFRYWYIFRFTENLTS